MDLLFFLGFLIAIAGLFAWLVYKLVPEPLKTIGLFLIAIVVLIVIGHKMGIV